jgi:hypothetical protein
VLPRVHDRIAEIAAGDSSLIRAIPLKTDSITFKNWAPSGQQNQDYPGRAIVICRPHHTATSRWASKLRAIGPGAIHPQHEMGGYM